MSEFNIINNCAPTLAGLKTGNIFNCQIAQDEDINSTIDAFNKVFEPKGLKMVLLRIKDNVAMLYLYRVKQLANDLKQDNIRSYLKQMEYPLDNSNECIEKLKHRINTMSEFPHEIGLFLGYPIEDVIGFSTLGANGAKYCGLWRVYGDVEKAKRQFALFRKCRSVYLNAYTKQNNFRKLIISK